MALVSIRRCPTFSTPKSFISSLVSFASSSPVMKLLTKFSLYSPNPISFSHSPTWSVLHSFLEPLGFLNTGGDLPKRFASSRTSSLRVELDYNDEVQLLTKTDLKVHFHTQHHYLPLFQKKGSLRYALIMVNYKFLIKSN